jgi:hypothetical protein
VAPCLRFPLPYRGGFPLPFAAAFRCLNPLGLLRLSASALACLAVLTPRAPLIRAPHDLLLVKNGMLSP